jgi:hypothetical protein
MQSIWGTTSIFITENGYEESDTVAEDGRVYDSDHVMVLRACLGQLGGDSEGDPVASLGGLDPQADGEVPRMARNVWLGGSACTRAPT